jgi:hypothetical protein
LHRELIELQTEYADQDYTSLLKGVSLWLLNTVELSSQAAAWHLLRQPSLKASRETVNIPTCWPHECQKMRKMSTQMEEENLTDESTDMWYDNMVQKYAK